MKTIRERAAEHLDTVENLLYEVEMNQSCSYKEVLVSLRASYWLLTEYLKLDEKYNFLLKRLEDMNKND